MAAPPIEKALVEADSAVDAIDAYAQSRGGWQRKFDDNELKKLSSLLNIARQKVDTVYALVDDGATLTDEQRFQLLVDVDNRYQGFGVLSFPMLGDAKTAANTILVNLKEVLDGWNLDPETRKRFEFYQKQAQFVIDYANKNEVFQITKQEGSPDVTKGTKPNPSWSELVGYEFWKYPPPAPKQPSKMPMWPWLLAVAVIVGIAYAQTKKGK